MKHQGRFDFLVLYLLLFCGSVKADVCADIIRENWNIIAKQENSPCETIIVWVPKKTGFTEFVNLNENNEVVGGFSIAIFCYALQKLPFNIQPIFTPFIDEKGQMNGTYDELVKQIEGKTCEAVAGDVAIRGNRAQYVSFTAPYLSSEVYMLVDATHEWKQTIWTFLRPFTNRLWITLICACILFELTLAILEYRAGNPEFAIPFFFHEGKIHNKGSKVVLVMWLCMIPIVGQIYTATLSSWLTLDHLRPKFPSSFCNAGYPVGSFINGLIIEHYNCSENNLRPLNGYEDYKNALSNGSVNVVFDQLPYVDLFLSKYGSDYMKVGPIIHEPGIAFAFAHKSPLLQMFSDAVINVTESQVMMDTKQKYLGISTLDKSQPSSAPPSLDVKSFIGLFIFMGMVMIGAIIASEISIYKRNKKVQDQNKKKEEPKELATFKSDTAIPFKDADDMEKSKSSSSARGF